MNYSVYTANVVFDLCHDRNIYHYPLHLYSQAELRDFLKALCTLWLPLCNCFCC